MSEHPKLHRTPAGIVKLLRSIEKAQTLIALVDKALVDSVVQARKSNPAHAKRIKPTVDKPYRKVVDADGEETGEVAFSFARMAKASNEQTGQTLIERPDMFDAKGTPLDPTKANIGDGSTIKIAFEIYAFYAPLVGAGVSLRLNAIQVLDLVKGPGRDAKGYGFVEEEGYEVDK